MVFLERFSLGGEYRPALAVLTLLNRSSFTRLFPRKALVEIYQFNTLRAGTIRQRSKRPQPTNEKPCLYDNGTNQYRQTSTH